jgi:polyisoprenoid-binding protein YceI
MYSKTVFLAAALFSTTSFAATAQLGKVAFEANTNVKMFHFKGEAGDLKSKVEIEADKLKDLEIRIPVDSLKTGMEIRDKHMRERVFTAPDGSTPDIVFTSTSASCQAAAGGVQNCSVSGQLSFRGITKPFTFEVAYKDSKQVSGHAVVDVLDYGVTEQALAWANVKVDPKTPVEFELSLQ